MSKLALITGGARGIGAVAARGLREQGWTAIAPTRAEADFDSLRAGEYAAAFLERRDRLDALVFCHGQWYSQKRQRPDDYLLQYTQRVVAPLFFMHALLPALRAARGCVVTVASTRGLIGGVDTGPYSLACAAQIAAMQGYAREWPGVRFNCICPSLTDTDMGREVVTTGGAKPGAVAQPPQAVAQWIMYLIESQENGSVVEVSSGAPRWVEWRR